VKYPCILNTDNNGPKYMMLKPVDPIKRLFIHRIYSMALYKTFK